MYEIRPTASSTLSVDGSAAMKKMLEEMTPVFRIYDVHFKNLIKKHELGTREDVNERVDIGLVDAPYNM